MRNPASGPLPSRLEIQASPVIVEAPPLGMGTKKLILKDRVTVREAMRILCLSERTIERMCEEGALTCIQPNGPGSRYQITLESVLARLNTPE